MKKKRRRFFDSRRSKKYSKPAARLVESFSANKLVWINPSDIQNTYGDIQTFQSAFQNPLIRYQIYNKENYRHRNLMVMHYPFLNRAIVQVVSILTEEPMIFSSKNEGEDKLISELWESTYLVEEVLIPIMYNCEVHNWCVFAWRTIEGNKKFSPLDSQDSYLILAPHEVKLVSNTSSDVPVRKSDIADILIGEKFDYSLKKNNYEFLIYSPYAVAGNNSNFRFGESRLASMWSSAIDLMELSHSSSDASARLGAGIAIIRSPELLQEGVVEHIKNSAKQMNSKRLQIIHGLGDDSKFDLLGAPGFNWDQPWKIAFEEFAAASGLPQLFFRGGEKGAYRATSSEEAKSVSESLRAIFRRYDRIIRIVNYLNFPDLGEYSVEPDLSARITEVERLEIEQMKIQNAIQSPWLNLQEMADTIDPNIKVPPDKANLYIALEEFLSKEEDFGEEGKKGVEVKDSLVRGTLMTESPLAYGDGTYSKSYEEMSKNIPPEGKVVDIGIDSPDGGHWGDLGVAPVHKVGTGVIKPNPVSKTIEIEADIDETKASWLKKKVDAGENIGVSAGYSAIVDNNEFKEINIESAVVTETPRCSEKEGCGVKKIQVSRKKS